MTERELGRQEQLDELEIFVLAHTEDDTWRLLKQRFAALWGRDKRYRVDPMERGKFNTAEALREKLEASERRVRDRLDIDAISREHLELLYNLAVRLKWDGTERGKDLIVTDLRKALRNIQRASHGAGEPPHAE